MAEYAGVLVFRGDAVLLVKERYVAWDRACWNVPSGRLEPGETPEAGAVRELREETGVAVDRPDDPDGIIEEAAWFPTAEAARLLAELPSAQIRVPALDHLATRRSGVRWTADEHGVRETGTDESRAGVGSGPP